MATRRDVYQSQGFIQQDRALSESELSALINVCETLLDEPPEDGGTGRHRIGLGEDRRFLCHRHRDFPELEAFVLGERMAELSADLLGSETYLFNEQFVVKGPDSGASFAWHQDSAYVGFDHPAYLTVWIALDDATEANGCVYVLPRDLAENPGVDPHTWLDGSRELNGYDGPETGLPAVCPAGSIVAFSSRTLHRSGANRTRHRRRAYVCQYSSAPIRDPANGELKRFATPLRRQISPAVSA